MWIRQNEEQVELSRLQNQLNYFDDDVRPIEIHKDHLVLWREDGEETNIWVNDPEDVAANIAEVLRRAVKELLVRHHIFQEILPKYGTGTGVEQTAIEKSRYRLRQAAKRVEALSTLQEANARCGNTCWAHYPAAYTLATEKYAARTRVSVTVGDLIEALTKMEKEAA